MRARAHLIAKVTRARKSMPYLYHMLRMKGRDESIEVAKNDVSGELCKKDQKLRRQTGAMGRTDGPADGKTDG